jgi:LPXTG-motif cell wall-anchored protein
MASATGIAWADVTIDINPGNVPTTAAGFSGHSCDIGGGPFANHDVWVFVLPGNTGDWVSLTATFNNGGPDIVDTITKAANPNNFTTNGTPKAFLVEPAGYTLTGASAVVTDDAASKTDKFNLTHTCPASETAPPPTSSITSQVELANNKVIDDNLNPGTAPADVHDSVTVTVTGLASWSGTINETFYKTNNCDSDIVDSASLAVNNNTKMPVSILPETKLPPGEYSYQAMFVHKNVDNQNDALSTDGLCEPFKIVAGPTTPPTTPPATPPTTTSTPSLPVTGASLTGVLIAGVVLIVAGGVTLFVVRRRRSITDQL